ncbi:MAG: Rid family detoxifying hydrolase [Mariprofundaceae bacterium]|nr:Rid family detoxifying hydrolase [Mariprofundaceae bacterium]
MGSLISFHSDQAPGAVGPYSQEIWHDNILYLSGQIGLAPDRGKLAGGGLEPQALQVMRNLEAVLDEAGAAISDIIKVGIYLTDMGDFPILNRLYADWLGEHRPARATVAVAALPLDARIEMDLVARIPGDAHEG